RLKRQALNVKVAANSTGREKESEWLASNSNTRSTAPTAGFTQWHNGTTPAKRRAIVPFYEKNNAQGCFLHSLC
ncbi:MAG: hypothetical protein ACKV1O_09870, partial [Saprospiraceae bacterium]